MKFNFTKHPINQEKTDCLIIGVYEGNTLTPQGNLLNKASNNYVLNFLKTEGFKATVGKTALIHHITGITSPRVLLVGLGHADKITPTVLSKILHSAFSALKTLAIHSATCYLTDIAIPDVFKIASLSAQNALYTFSRYKSDKQTISLSKVSFYAENPSKAEKAALAQGAAIAEGMALARDLGNEPPNVCTPAYLAEQAKKLAKTCPSITTKVLDEAEMKKLGMGALLAVGQGSKNPPKLIIMEYKGGKKNEQPFIFVGKGITFDSGGLSLKPAAAMEEMKWDMMGAATVFGLMHTVAELKLPLNVIGIVPTAENMPDGQSYRPSDIVTSMSGQTIEIVNTDAEGRLILCDALTYAAKYKPQTIIDIATLTGSIVVALGFELSGVFANDDTLAAELIEAGNEIADRAWHMPLMDDYQFELDSAFADMTNCGSRWGGSITAACFLSRFTKDYRWAHIDNAGTGFSSGAGYKGANGRPIALLMNYLLKQC
jgi:leucyl aminopeptidase